MVSERVREFGADSPVEGDLVYDDDDDDDAVVVAEGEEAAAAVVEAEETQDDDGEMAQGNEIDAPATDGSTTAIPIPSAVTGQPPKSVSKKDWKTTRCHKTRILTAADLAVDSTTADEPSDVPSSTEMKKKQKKWSVFDVVMPLPGFEVDLPGGRLGEMFKQILKADGLDQDDVWKRQK